MAITREVSITLTWDGEKKLGMIGIIYGPLNIADKRNIQPTGLNG